MFLRTLFTATLVGCLNLSSPSFATTVTLTELDKGEPYDAMTFNGDYLFVGHSRKDFNSNFHVQIFDRKDQMVKDIPLKHSAAHLRRYNANSVIVVGTAYEPNLTHYTIITTTGVNQFSTRVVQVPADAWAQDWLGTVGGREYFADMGGNPNDEETTTDPTIASQTIFSTNSRGTPRYMSTRLRGPNFGTTFGSDLIIARFNDMTSPSNFLARVSTSTGAVTPALKGTFLKIHDTKIKAGTSLIAVSERDGSQVAIGDLNTGEIIAQASIKGKSGAVEWFGKCLIASSIDEKTIFAYDMSTPAQPQLLKTIAFSDTGAVFAGLRGMTIDSKTGRVYGRSAYACNPMIQACVINTNSVAVLDLATSTELLGLCKI